MSALEQISALQDMPLPGPSTSQGSQKPSVVTEISHLFPSIKVKVEPNDQVVQGQETFARSWMTNKKRPCTDPQRRRKTTKRTSKRTSTTPSTRPNTAYIF